MASPGTPTELKQFIVKMYYKTVAQLTEKQIKRQDFVDNEVFGLIQRIVPSAKIKWDIDIIGNVWDSIRTQLVDKQKLMSEAKFYPYLKI